MNQLPTISSYGEYKSENYGVNSLQIRFSNGLTLFYSYSTIIAFRGSDGLKVRQNAWSTTTGKHLNWIDGGNKKDRLGQDDFEALLIQELEHHKLVTNKKELEKDIPF